MNRRDFLLLMLAALPGAGALLHVDPAYADDKGDDGGDNDGGDNDGDLVARRDDYAPRLKALGGSLAALTASLRTELDRQN